MRRVFPVLLALAGCPDTERGGPAPEGDHTALTLLQKVDTSEVKAKGHRGRPALSPDGLRLYQTDWVAGTSWFDRDPNTGLLTNLRGAGTGCNQDAIALSADGQVAYIATYFAWACGRALSIHPVGPDGALGEKSILDSWGGKPAEVAPTGTEALLIHPSNRWLYLAFDNQKTGVGGQISRQELNADHTTGALAMYTIPTAKDEELAGFVFSPDASALYVSEKKASRLDRFGVDVANGTLSASGSAQVGTSTAVQAVCSLGGKDHVYAGSLADDPATALASGALWHHVFLGGQIQSSTAVRATEAPGLARMRFVADKACRHLFVAGNDVVGGAWKPMLLVMAIDPKSGDTTVLSRLEGIVDLTPTEQPLLSPDDKFLYLSGDSSPYLHVFQVLR